MSSGSQYLTNGEGQLANNISGTEGSDGFGSVPNIPNARASSAMLHIAADPIHQYVNTQQQIDTQGRVIGQPQIILQPQFFQARNPQLPMNHPHLQAMQFPGNQQYVLCPQPQGFIMSAGQPSPPVQNRPQYIVLPNGSYSGGQVFCPGYPQPSLLALQSTAQPMLPSAGVPIAHPGTLVAAPQPTSAASPFFYGATTVPEVITTAAALTPNQDSTGMGQPSWDGTTLRTLQPAPVAGADLEQVKRVAKSDMPHRPLHAYNYFFIDERERILKQDVQESPPANSKVVTTSAVEGGVCNDNKEEEMKRKKRILDRQLQRDRTKRRPHRKTHGKISFRGLSSRISQTWRKMADEKKQFYKDIAALDAQRYRNELEVREKEAQGDASPS